jgi:hypothetical protein
MWYNEELIGNEVVRMSLEKVIYSSLILSSLFNPFQRTIINSFYYLGCNDSLIKISKNNNTIT